MSIHTARYVFEYVACYTTYYHGHDSKIQLARHVLRTNTRSHFEFAWFTSRGFVCANKKGPPSHAPSCIALLAAFLNVGSSWNGSIITKTTPASSTSLLVGISSSYANYSINPTNRLYSSCCWLEESLVIAIFSDL